MSCRSKRHPTYNVLNIEIDNISISAVPLPTVLRMGIGTPFIAAVADEYPLTIAFKQYVPTRLN